MSEIQSSYGEVACRARLLAPAREAHPKRRNADVSGSPENRSKSGGSDATPMDACILSSSCHGDMGLVAVQARRTARNAQPSTHTSARNRAPGAF